MRRSIATVSLSGTLDEKLSAIAAAHFGGVEMFDNDLVNFSGKPREVHQRAADLGLSIDLFQPFRDLERVPDDILRRKLHDDALIYIATRGVRSGSPETLARLAGGEPVDAVIYDLYGVS